MRYGASGIAMTESDILEARLRPLLEAGGLGGLLRLEPLTGGLATRQFFRLTLDGDPASVIARIEGEDDPSIRPEGVAPEPDLEPTRSLLEAAGLPVPRCLGDAKGVYLLEDLGDATLCEAANARPPRLRRPLYEEALALLPRIQALTDTRLPALARSLDARLIDFKAQLFARFSLPAALGHETRPAETKVVSEAFAWIADALAGAPRRVAHRDFQSRNLLLHARAGEPERLFMIDLQGAFLAPPEYDVVSLLCDSYVELEADESASLAEWVRPRLPDAPEPEEFMRRFDLVTLLRKSKDHARYLQAGAAGRDPGYLRAASAAAARCLKRAAERVASADPRLADLAQLVLSLPEPRCEP
jgi:aminoglycoside/choline kinase family phosphotransferase